jgi:biopolymer transport protein ExbD
MNFRNRTQSEIPLTDMIPMLNVMLGLMAYFIIVTMTMAAQSSFNLKLPDEVNENDIENVETTLLVNQGPMVVELAPDGRFVIEKAQLNDQQLIEQIKLFLEQNKTDPIFLKPDKQQGYEKVLQTLALMRKIGGDRISIVIDEVGS